MAGLTTVEGAVFALIGLLLAFTISGALQRFDERRQLVIQEANAVSTAYSWMKNETFFVPVRARWHEPWKDKNGDEIHHESNFALTVRIPSRRRQRQAERHVTVPLTNATFGFVPQQRTPIP
jgi:hypothetical protein